MYDVDDSRYAAIRERVHGVDARNRIREAMWSRYCQLVPYGKRKHQADFFLALHVLYPKVVQGIEDWTDHHVHTVHLDAGNGR